MDQLNQNRRVTEKIDPVSEQIQGMLEGKINVPSPLAEYLLDGIKQTAVEDGALRKKLQEAEVHIAQFRLRLMELKGIGEKAYTDLRTQLGKDILHAVGTEQ